MPFNVKTRSRGSLGRTSARSVRPFTSFRYRMDTFDRPAPTENQPSVPRATFVDKIREGRDISRYSGDSTKDNNLEFAPGLVDMGEDQSKSVSTDFKGGRKMIADSASARQFLKDNKAYQLKLRLLRGVKPLKRPSRIVKRPTKDKKGGLDIQNILLTEAETKELSNHSQQFKELAEKLKNRNKGKKFSLVGISSWIRKHIMPLLTGELGLPKMAMNFLKKIKLIKTPVGGVSIPFVRNLARNMLNALVEHRLKLASHQFPKGKKGGSLYLSGASDLLKRVKEKGKELIDNLSSGLMKTLTSILKRRHSTGAKGGSLRLAGMYGQGKFTFKKFTQKLKEIFKKALPVLGKIVKAGISAAPIIASVVAPELGMPIDIARRLANTLLKKHKKKAFDFLKVDVEPTGKVDYSTMGL